jgi:hypothetical protein
MENHKGGILACEISFRGEYENRSWAGRVSSPRPHILDEKIVIEY